MYRFNCLYLFGPNVALISSTVALAAVGRFVGACKILPWEVALPKAFSCLRMTVQENLPYWPWTEPFFVVVVVVVVAVVWPRHWQRRTGYYQHQHQHQPKMETVPHLDQPFVMASVAACFLPVEPVV